METNTTTTKIRVFLRQSTTGTEAVYAPAGDVYPLDQFSVPLSFEITDVNDLGKSRGSGSKTVTIIADATAERIFGHLTDIAHKCI